LNNLPECCQKVILVSAYGVGSSIYEANMGIKLMQSFYLKNVYKSKQLQEDMVNNLPKYIDRRILRPKVLSYGPVPLNSIATPRQQLAKEIIQYIQEE
jgi:hypothetical protein